MTFSKYFSILFCLCIYFYPLIVSSSSELQLHNIFNKKLITPLKLGEDKQTAVINLLNNFSKEMLSIEDKLKENLTLINNELKEKVNEKDSLFENLIAERINLIDKLSALENKKNEMLKDQIPPHKMAYYFILRQKLVNKFKKAIDISVLTE